MKKEQIQILQNAREICDSMAKAITKRNSGQPFCQNYCPGEDRLISIIQQLVNAIKDNEPESSTRLAEELQKVKQILPNQCVNPYSFGAIVNILSRKYLNPKGDTRKLFISHSSKDKAIVNGFIKEILKIGCGFKDSDIFCTLDSTVIRTGDDFRIKIVENLRECDFILLFISENYMNSEICQNEMGAAWAYDSNVRLYLLPDTNFNSIGWLCDTRKANKITDTVALDLLYKEMHEYYSLPDNFINWSQQREIFINR